MFFIYEQKIMSINNVSRSWQKSNECMEMYIHFVEKFKVIQKQNICIRRWTQIDHLLQSLPVYIPVSFRQFRSSKNRFSGKSAKVTKTEAFKLGHFL